jgi:hypothetical protein
MPTFKLGLVVLLASVVVGCGDGRDPTDSGTLYGCSAKSDCLSNYDCICGFCQLAGETIGCDGGGKDINSAPDTASKDTATKVDSGSADAGPVDTGPPANCNILTWAPCPTGQGCYYDSSKGKGVCGAYGSKKKNDKCSNAGNPECGKDDATPMLCDSVDSKCYPMCAASKGGPCPAGQQCYTLEENKQAWPDDAGICAP